MSRKQLTRWLRIGTNLSNRKVVDEMTRLKWTIAIVLLLMISTVVVIDVVFEVGAIKWLISYTTLYAFFVGTSLTMRYYLTGLFNNEEEPMW